MTSAIVLEEMDGTSIAEIFSEYCIEQHAAALALFSVFRCSCVRKCICASVVQVEE